jgi:hypothetical protein
MSIPRLFQIASLLAVGWSELKIYHTVAYIRRFADPDAE